MDFFEVIITAVPEWIESFIEVVVTAVPQFFQDAIDIIVTAVPAGFGLPAIMVMSGFSTLLFLNWYCQST